MGGKIYFIGCAETGRVKIGFTRGNPYARLASLQTGAPTKLHMMAWMRGSFEDERAIHEQFAASRIRGEWFEPTEGLFEHLSMVAWLTASEVRDAGSERPDWLCAALTAMGAADQFPTVMGVTIQ